MFLKYLCRTFIFTVMISLPVACYAALPAKETKSSQDPAYKYLNLFEEVYNRVKQDYVESVTDEQLIESALNGMLTALDPHSAYLNKKAFEEMRIQTKGEFGGLGIEVTMENGLVKVVSPIDDTPAFHAGVKQGDFISHIDEEAVIGMSLQEAVDKMRGPSGQKVKLTLLREGANEPIDLTITREVIRIRSVKSSIEGDIGYLRITSFSENTSNLLQDAVNKIQQELGDSLKGYVLDLRNNPGGLLDQAVAVSDVFLDKGEIVSTRGRRSDSISRVSAKPGDIISGKSIVILINGGSASASEIVAGALQDHKRAIVMGTKSFGKGSVQTIMPINNYGAIRITTARYYTPSGTSIQAEGIVPNIIVEQIKIDSSDSKENIRRFSEANLRKHLSNDNKKPNIDDKEKVKDHSKNEKSPEKENNKNQPIYLKDYQLSRAIDLLRGLSVIKPE
jgi:carboxyl-terminal processing protease